MEVYFSSGELVQVTGLEMVEFRCQEFSAMAGSALWQDRPRPSYRRLRTLLLPLHLTAPLKPTTPLSLLPFTTKQISESSSIFSLFSDRNFLGMDEKFAISLGWMLRSSGIFPSLNVSLLLLHDHFTNPGYPTVVKPSTLSPRSGIAALSMPTRQFTPLPTPMALLCHLFVYSVCKATFSGLPSSFHDEADFRTFVNSLSFL